MPPPVVCAGQSPEARGRLLVPRRRERAAEPGEPESLRLHRHCRWGCSTGSAAYRRPAGCAATKSKSSLLPLIQYSGARGCGYSPSLRRDVAGTDPERHLRMARHHAIERLEIAVEIADCAKEHAIVPYAWNSVSGELEPTSCRRDGVSRRRHEQIFLVPDEIALVVDRELVVLAHEDRRHRARFFAVAAEDAARLVNLVGDRVARPRHARCRRSPPPRGRSRRPGTPPRTARTPRTSRGPLRRASAPVCRATSETSATF